ncbi:CGNR zinc finger domain-containing protein [Micromonospora sp. NPDC047074]|uniref:CGNR zinc finger domain-containing protein n=1 Tax=Micromonospora sp. NPDC047074 TaxID=3154339 RepID=UPI0033F01617
MCERGINRLGVCAEPRCRTAFLDDSSNRVRRFCSARCATRTHVRAHRARQQAPPPGPTPPLAQLWHSARCHRRHTPSQPYCHVYVTA